LANDCCNITECVCHDGLGIAFPFGILACFAAWVVAAFFGTCFTTWIETNDPNMGDEMEDGKVVLVKESVKASPRFERLNRRKAM
jgi:hypothetical protein